MNPLLNRIYETKNRKQSTTRQNNSSVDKVLVPKLNPKIKLQSLHGIQSQKNTLIKPYIGRLPSLHKEKPTDETLKTQKKIELNKSRVDFRSRRMSSHIRENQTSISIFKDSDVSFQFQSEHKIPAQNERQPLIQFERRKTLFKQVSSMLTEPIFEDNQNKLKKSRQPTLQNNQTSLLKVKEQPKIYDQDEGQEDQLFEYLNILQTNPDLNEQFCYMNRTQKPYSFYIVDYQDRNLNEHLTVSLRGITYYKIQNQQAENEFFTIQAMTRDVQRYRIIKKIPFFKDYVIQKALNHWKFSMFQRKFINKCQYLKQNLFSQNEINILFFNKLHTLYQQFCKGNFFDMNIIFPLPCLAEIKDKNMVQKRKETEKNFVIFQKDTKKSLIECLKQNMTKFRRQKRVTLGTSDKLQKSQSFLPFDNKKKTMKFTQLAKLKEFEGYLFKIIKYTDMVRYNLKIEYVKTSISNSSRQMKNLLANYQNRNSRTFVSWIECQVEIVESVVEQKHTSTEQIENEEGSFLTSFDNKDGQVVKNSYKDMKNQKKIKRKVPTIKFTPEIEEIKLVFLDHRDQCIKQLWNNHFFLADNKDELFCAEYDREYEQSPTKLDLKHYLKKTPQLIQLNLEFQQSLRSILDKIAVHKTFLTQKLLKIYIDSFLDQPIENYLQNERLKQYLSSYLVDKDIIQKTQDVIEFGLVLLKAQNFKTQVKKIYQEKYKTLITAIPQQVLKRTQSLARQVRDIYFKFKDNPKTIRDFIDFYKVFDQEKAKLVHLQKKIEDLLELQVMIHKNGIKVPQNSRTHIAESQTLFRQLEKRFEQIQENQQKERKKFEVSIDGMIPQIQQKAQGLLQQIQSCDLIHSPSSQLSKVLVKLNDYEQSFNKIRAKKQELFLYQIQLNLGHKDLQNYFRLEITYEWYNMIWNGHKEFLNIQKITKEKGYGQIQNLQTASLSKHLKNLQNAESDIQALELIQQFRQKTIRLTHVIKLAKLIATETLQPEHCQQIKKIMTFTLKKVKDLLFTREGSRNITCEQFYANTNVVQIQAEVSEIAFLSLQQNIIKKKLSQIEDFWKKNKVKFIGEDILTNGTLILHLDQNQELHQKIGLFNLALKNIQSSGQAKGPILQKLEIQIKTTVYLRKLLLLWAEVQRQWLKLLPMMTNCPSVKHQSNVYFEFTSVDQKMRKLIKQISDMSSMRRLVEDYVEKKNINVLQLCESQLKQINKTFQNFLESKRSTYNRFYFLTDEQLVSIIQNVKDSRSMAKYGGYCFNCDHLDMDNELINGLQTENQIFKLRKLMLRGEPDEMFKSISQNMKSSMKFGIRNLVPKMKISTNIEQELKQNSLQVCLLADLLIWTEMTETYLNATSYEEYQLITKRPAQEMARLLPKISKQLWMKVAIRFCQASHLKQKSESLIQQQVTKNDFRWKQQMKFSFEEDEIAIRQFDKKLIHGLEYYPPQKIFIPTLNTQRLLYESYYACLNYKVLSLHSYEGEGKRNLIKYTASRVGIYHKEVVCNSNLKINYLMRFVQGAIQAGAWLSFYESSNLKDSVAYQLLDNISSLKNQEKCHPRTLFMLVNHQPQYQKISMFKYHNYSMVEPDHKKICQYLLQMYRFRQWEELSKKILSYLKTIKPLMQNIMGSHLNLIRKIVDGAGHKKLNSKNASNQNDMVVEIIKKEIIDKSEQNVAILLRKALASYFNTESLLVDPKKQYQQKLSVLKDILNKKQQKNLLVIGNRSCKSTLIKQAILQLNLETIKLFPETQSQFLTSYSIDYFNFLHPDKVLIYDGDHVVPEFKDIITSGYLLIEGRKVVIRQKIILELRSIQDCTPSFIQNCQIIYVGNVVSKTDKFLKHCPLESQSDVWQILEEVFGQSLLKMHDDHIETFAKIINRFKGISQTRSVHKIIIWLLSVLKDEEIWQRNYSGKHTDFTLHEKYLQLVAIDPSKSSPLQCYESNFYLVPTKSSILVSELTNCLLNLGLHVEIYGSQQIGKTSFMKLLKGSKIGLSVYNNTEYWSEYIKDKLLLVRKEAKNFLLPIGQSAYKIIIDDIDLGNRSHSCFVHGLIQSSEMRDEKYHRYFLQQFNVIVSSRTKNLKSKVDQTLVKIPLFSQSKQSLSSIFLVNVEHFFKANNTNRQVVDYFERTVLKAFLIAFDDFSNLYTCNIGTAQLISIQKQLLSIPKKNAYISVEDFSSLFKSIFYQKIVDKSFNKRLKWQLNSVYENIAKIIFNNELQWSFWMNVDCHYKKTTVQEIQQMIRNRFSNLMIYPDMVQKIIFINNQLQSLNPNIALVGRKGVGKRHLSKISASFNKIQTVHTLKEAIFSALKSHPCVLVEQVKRNTTTQYEKMNECQVDGDLQRFLDLNDREKFRQHINSTEGLQSTQILSKINKYVKNIVLLDDKHQYLKLCEGFRTFNQFSVCILDQWPLQAIVNVYKTVDGNQNLHAHIFSTANQILFQNNLNYMPMTIYEKYIQIYSQVYQHKRTTLQQKKLTLTQMYTKFNQSGSLIRQWQQKVNQLQNQLTQTIQDLSKHIEVDKINAFIVFAYTKSQQAKREEIKGKKDKLEQSKNEMQIEVKITKRILERIEKIISSLQRTELSELKKIYRTNKLVEFGLQCLCILMKEKQDDISEKTINKLLADPNLLMKMKSPDVLAVKNMYLMTKFKKELPQHENMMKNHTTETSKILVEWIKAIIEYWEVTDVHNSKRQSFKQLEAQYNAVATQYQTVLDQLKKLSQKTSNIDQTLAKLEKQKILKEQQLTTINLKLQNSSEVIPILLKAQQQVQMILKKVNIFLDNLVGNAILIAFTATFLPLKRLTIRSKLLDSVKKLLRKNIISFSQFFIHEIISQDIFSNDFDEETNKIQNLNIFLIENFPQKLKIIIDPERKAINYLQNYPKKPLQHIIDSIVEKAQDLKEDQFKTQSIYHSTSENLLIETQKCLIIDWKTIETNPEERLFNRIAFAKKPEYFKTKTQLTLKVEKNLKKIEDMKNQLYKVICESAIKILEDKTFLLNGKELIELQIQTQTIKDQIKSKVQLIQSLEKQINSEVKSIFILLRLFKEIRPIGLNLILDPASREGDSIQNVISWALTNLPPSGRTAYLLAVANEFTGKSHEQLLSQIIVNAPLKVNEVKLKKPSLVSASNWEKVMKLSTYTDNLKHMIELVQKHQKEFEAWVNNYSPILTPNLSPEKLQMNEHLFMVFHLKPKVFPQSVQIILRRGLIKYELKPLKNVNLFAASNQLDPVVYHCSILKLLKMCEQLNESRIETIRIGSIRTDSEMKKKIWKCMQNSQWMVMYGFTCNQDIEWMQKIVYYVQNYQKSDGFRVVILPGQSIGNSNTNNLLNSSKYLTSISIHLYDEIPQYIQLMQGFQLFNPPDLALNNLSFKQRSMSLLIEDDGTSKTLRLSSRSKPRKGSIKQNGQSKIFSLLSLDRESLEGTQLRDGELKGSLLSLPLLNKQNNSMDNGSFVLTKGADKFLNRLYKHLLLAHLVILRKFNDRLQQNSFEILKRAINLVKYIEENSIPIQFNVQSIIGYLKKLYSNELSFQDFKCAEQIIERIVDQTRFNQKIIYGVNIANFTSVESQLQNNSAILGADESYFIRESMHKWRHTMRILDQIFSPQDLKQETIFLRLALGKIPIMLSNKDISNENYYNFYFKQQKIHNQLIKKTQNLLDWINTYANKTQNGQQIEPENQYTWQNLMRQIQDTVGYQFNRNQLHDVITNFTQNLKKSHDFLLYFNPSLTSYTVNPTFVSNFQALISTFTINYLSANNVKDAYNFVPNLEFKKAANNAEVTQMMLQYGIDGIVLNNLLYRDFKWNNEFRLIEALVGEMDGEEKAPIILYKLKRLTRTQKEEEEIFVNLMIKEKTRLRSETNERVFLKVPLMCTYVYPEFNMRDNSLVIDDMNNS